MIVLGLHGGVTGLQHDGAAALLVDGRIAAAAEEERFIRVKHALGHLPIRAIRAVLSQAGLAMGDVDMVVHTGETHADLAERVRLYLSHYFGHVPRLEMVDHQLAHMASAYYCSGFDRALVLSLDGLGDRKSGAIGVGSPEGIEVLETIDITRSLGNYYGTMTSFLGFGINEDEFKVMGLAAYGRPGVDMSPILAAEGDGYRLRSDIWARTPVPRSRFEPWYGPSLPALLGPPRRPDSPLEQRHRDIAFATQAAFEEAVAALIGGLRRNTGLDAVCAAGGCFLNCAMNGEMVRRFGIEDYFVQPAASDQGSALGGALLGARMSGEALRAQMDHAYLGPDYSPDRIRRDLGAAGAAFTEPEDLVSAAADLLAAGKIVAWFEGRSEFGPRALGHRSILAHPGLAGMKDAINSRVKFRESFRPFAPAVKADRARDVFHMDMASPFMTVAFPAREAWASRLPAIIHVDGTARVQTVSPAAAPNLYALLDAFEDRTGLPALLNTSFNIKGQPIVETPLDALSTFAATGLDALAIGPFLLEKPSIPGRT